MKLIVIIPAYNEERTIKKEESEIVTDWNDSSKMAKIFNRLCGCNHFLYYL